MLAMKARSARTYLIGSILLLVTSGCASVLSRQNWREPGIARYVYPGVSLDAQIIAESGGRQPDDPWGSFGVIAVPFCLIDLPLSFAVDTVILPYDVAMVTIGGKTRTGRSRAKDNESAETKGMPAASDDHGQPVDSGNAR